MTSSRFTRPEHPATPIVLTARDRAVFALLRDYRLLNARHLQIFAFSGTSLRRTQARLRQLWEHHLLNRYFRPVVTDGTRPFTLEPAYGLGRRSTGLDVGGDLLGPPKEPSPMTFDHEVAVGDCLSALTAACRGCQDIELVSATPAAPLWRTFRPTSGDLFRVPDGAIRLRYGQRETLTFYIEIVRADVRGGNATLVRKMEEYAALNRDGRFRERYGHDNLRAVLFLTTSDARAENFRQLAGRLTHGRRLFWFGSYQTTAPSGREVTSLTPDTILTPRWRTVDGQPASLLEPSRP